MKKALLLVAFVLLTGTAQGATRALPPPVFSTPGSFEGLAASGPALVLMVHDPDRGCVVRLGPPGQLAVYDAQLPCRASAQDGDSTPIGLWLGRASVAGMFAYSESPHSEDWSFWKGPRPAGPMKQVGGVWTWNDSDVPAGDGCAWTVVAGGGVIAAAQGPNRLAVEQGLAAKPSCPSTGATTVELDGAPQASFTVAGSWAPLAADGRRIVLAQLDALGRRTGAAELVDLTGRKLPFVQPVEKLVREASDMWLAPEGVVVRTGGTIYGKGWTAHHLRGATVGEGRVLYVSGAELRVHRIAGGPDRLVTRLPKGGAALAAGSFGVALTIDSGSRLSLYRFPWRTIDRTLTANG